MPTGNSHKPEASKDSDTKLDTFCKQETGGDRLSDFSIEDGQCIGS